jgi:hypothetical protein
MYSWLAGFAILIGVYVLFFRRSRQLIAGQGREDFGRNVRALLLACKSGGTMEVSAKGLELRFEVTKGDVLGDGAIVIIRLPVDSLSVSALGGLLKAYSQPEYEVRRVKTETSRDLLEILVRVDNIWEEWSGASTARAIHLLLDALVVPKEVKFDLHLSGPVNWKWVAREWARM